MADTIFTRSLARAVEVEGGTQAVAYMLRVPESTLVRWLAGRAQMPLQAFHCVIDRLVAHERRTGEPKGIGHFPAECRRCDGAQLEPAAATGAPGMTSVLVCPACKAQTTHGELLAALATQAIRQSREAASRPVRSAGVSASRDRGRRSP